LPLSRAGVAETSYGANDGNSLAGEIYAIDPLVDVNGRAPALRARLPNADMASAPAYSPACW
jgi:membrane fusion protein (multidrug efflux system)